MTKRVILPDMKKRIFILLLIVLPVLWQGVRGQTFVSAGDRADETVLYAMNKQVNQFVRRFNMEEDPFGKRLPATDPKYHNNKLRKKFLPLMFDEHNPRTAGKLREYFIQDVTDKKHPVYLNFLDKNWFAEVSATFYNAQGQTVHLIIFLTVEQSGKGSKWIISNVYDTDLHKLFPLETAEKQAKYFLHPQSHELDFMNLRKALNNPENIEYYAADGFRPDYLSLFFYLIKNRQLTFKQINGVKFHFFQIKNWYFELSWFNRNETNSGWLISNLKYIDEPKKKELIKFYKSCSTND